MGLRDFFRRGDDEWEDPPGQGRENPAPPLPEELEQAGTFIDEHGRWRVMPDGLRQSLEQAMTARRESSGAGPEDDDGDL